MRKIHIIYRAMVIMAREMFIGYILGLCAAVLLYKINPATQSGVALLIPAGVAAGIFKGLIKFVILNVFSLLPSKGYRFNYPKYKLLSLWLTVWFATFTYVFGLKFSLWVTKPIALLQNNLFIGFVGKPVWTAFFVVVTVAGLLSYFYEPPFDQDEFLPPVTPEEE